MQNNKAILIVGNGPSSSYPAAGKLAKGCEVARLSWFFLEKEQIFGKQVDYLFHASSDLLMNYLSFVVSTHDVYHINNNIDLNQVHTLRKVKTILKNEMLEIDISAPRHPLRHNPIPRETTALCLLKYFLESGYKTIHIAGIDFYQGEYQYINIKNPKMSKLSSIGVRTNMKTYHHKDSAHTLEHDIKYLRDLLAQYPDVKIIATSCHPETTKIWQQFKQVEVMEFSSDQAPEIYDAYLDKPWLQQAVADFSKKYTGFALFKLKLPIELKRAYKKLKRGGGGEPVSQ